MRLGQVILTTIKTLSVLATTMAVILFIPSLTYAQTSCTAANIRTATTSNTIYVSGPVTCTLTDIKTFKPNALLSQVDPAGKIWLLKSNLVMQNGAKLNLYGSGAGGDVNELRLISNNSTTAGSVIFVRAYWGVLDIKDTKIISWDETAGGPDTEYAAYKRSYIHARSFLGGGTPRESRMNIAGSEIAYLGFNGAEAYGVAWKVLGTTPGIYDQVNVYGNVVGSNIHHNYFGAYTFGADSMLWQNNQIHDNVQYGLDPHDDSDNLTITGNTFYNNGNHGLICSQRCNNLTIRNNTSRNNIGNGIMLHRNTNDSLIENNIINDNRDSGIAIFDSHNNTLRGNTSRGNKNGIRLSVGSSGNRVENNEFGENTKYGIYFYKGTDAPTSGDGRPKQNQFAGNNIHGNKDYMVKLKEGDNNTFENNTFSANAREFVMENARNNIFVNNTMHNNIQNFYHAKNGSMGIVRDTAESRVKIGDTESSIDIVSTKNQIFQNSKNIFTQAENGQTKIVLTRSLSADPVLFTPQAFLVNPSSGQIMVSPENGRIWNEKASSSGITANHNLENLTPNTSFDILVNGTLWQTVISDAGGRITFNYDGGYSASDDFQVTESLAAPASILEVPANQNLPSLTPSPSPSPSASPEPVVSLETPLSTPTEPGPTESPTPAPTETPAASDTPLPTASTP